MTLFDHWELQKQNLRTLLDEQDDLAGAVYQIRHALLQTEQNALAEISDDILRQQAGVLLGCIKNSAGLLETNISAQVWIPQSKKGTAKRDPSLWLAACGLLLLACILCVFKGYWLILALIVAGAATGLTAFLHGRVQKQSASVQDESRVILKPDTNQIFTLLDAQIRMADCCINDFIYLNEQLRGSSECTDTAAVSRAADLLEALYDCDEEQRSSAEEAAFKLLESLGMQALDYSEETSRLFNALPSKTMTRTLSPAIVSIKEQRLLRRGTAAVRIDAA